MATLAAVVPIIVYANIAGAPVGGASPNNMAYSSAPVEQNCAHCHDSTTVGDGSVSIAFPNGLFYTPGTSQTWVLTIADTSQLSWGFQLSARQGTNGSSAQGSQAGSFQPGEEANTQVVCGTATFTKSDFLNIPSGSPCPSGDTLSWIEQTWNPTAPVPPVPLGARLGNKGPVTFTFGWTPPSTDVGPVDIYISAVAGDGNDETANSHVYNAHYTLTVPVSNQPAIAPGGVVNAASYKPGVGPGSYVTILGTNLANTTASWSGSIVNGKLPTSLAGTSVTVGGYPAYIEYVSPTQVNVLLSEWVPLGQNLTVQLENNGLASTQGTISTQAISPAFFLWNTKYAVATTTNYGYVGPANLFPNTTTTPAKAGEVIILWASGLGVTQPQATDGVVTPKLGFESVLRVPTITIGGIPATLISAVLSPGYAGLYQIAVTVPGGLSDGDQPISIQQGSYQSPSGVYLTIKN